MENLLAILDRVAGVRDSRFDRDTLLNTIETWWRRYLTRRCLRELDPRLLGDIGISAAQRQRECAKWFFE